MRFVDLYEYHRHIGFVVIGRNEGERLKRCLLSIFHNERHIVYVDSGSSDGSLEYAKSLNIDIINLDMSIPFSAARARNEGFHLLTHKYKHIEYVQFIDGDCELNYRWVPTAYSFLLKNPECAIVAGRRHEKFPDNSIYNLLCDIEWDTPIGKTSACGGDFIVRKSAFLQVNGFNPDVVAGEEPDLCYRLRAKNWSIYRLDHSMTLHDAAISHFTQWWKRTVRTGHAYAQGLTLHFYDWNGYCLKESMKCWFWALFFPLTVILLCLIFNTLYVYLFLVYVIQFTKIALFEYHKSKNIRKTLLYSLFTIIAKWPQFSGQLIYLKRKFLKKDLVIIEYT